MQNIYTPQLFSPYSVSKQNQPNQVQRSTPFDEDNDTSKSGSQIVNQVQVSPHNPINLDELFDDKQIKSKNDIPFWEYDYEQEQPQGKGNNSEIDLFNLDQNFQNQIKGETSQNQNLKPQGFEQKQEQIKRDQNEILDAFDEDFEQFPQIIPQQNNTDQIPKAIDKQRNFESQNNYLQDNIFDNPQPPLKTNLQMTFHPQNDNYFQETKIGNQQNKDETQQSIVQFFDQQQDNNLWFEPNNNTPPNQSQVFQSQKSLSEKYVPNSQNTSQIKQQPQQPQQVEYYNGTQFMFQQQEETKKQNQVINFDIESDQEAKQQKSMNNSQQDYSEVIWKQQQTTKNQLIDFYPFQVSNNFDINKELNQSDQLHQWPNQNNDDINFRQQYNNNQFNINFSQNDFFNYEQDKKDQNFFINNNQVIQSAKSIDKIQFNQQDNITQTSGQNQFNVQKPQNTVQSESDDGSNHFQPNFQNLLNNDFGTYDWNTQQIKIKSESQHSVQDLEQRNNGWDSSQFGYFFKEFPKNENDNKSQEKSVQSYNEQVFEPINFLSQQGSQTYQQGEQSINNSQSHTQFVFGTQTQDQDNNFKQETQQSQEQKNDNIKILDQYVQDRQYLNNQYDYDFAEQKVNMIDDSKIIQQSQNQTQSFEFPSSFQMGIHSVRESKEDNKELSFVEQVMELLKPKIAEMAQNLSNEFINTDFNFKQEGQARLFQGIQDIFQKEKKRVELDLLNQQVQIIKDIVIKYDNKTEQLQEQFIRMKEEQERERQNKINISVDSIQLRKSQDIDQQIEESPIQNIQLQVSPNLFTPKTSQEKPYVPFQLIHQTQSKYLNESGISQDIKEEDLIKFKTNYIFQRNLLKGLQQCDVQNFRKQCLNNQVILLETQELMIISNEERNDNKNQGYKLLLKFKNKGRYGIQNLIVCFEARKFKNNLEANPQKITHQYLYPGETIQQEIKFKYYDQLEVFVICHLKYTINDNRNYQSQGQQGIQYQEYRSQISHQNYNNSYQNQYSQCQEFNKRNYQFIVGRPANKFFTYNYWTVEELSEYKMRYQGEEFQLRSLEDLIIYHPWLVKIDSQTLCGKIFIRLEENDYDFVLKLKIKDQKGVIQMNQTDMDQKLCEHLLSFLSFLFCKLF